MMLLRIRIANYLCFEAFEFEATELSLLLGRNGTGKSTLLSLLFALRHLVIGGEHIDELPVLVRLPPATSTRHPHFILDLADQEGALQYSLELARGPNGLGWRIHAESIRSNGKDEYSFARGNVRLEGRAEPTRMLSGISPLSVLDVPQTSTIGKFRQWVNGIWLLRLQPQQMAASCEKPADFLMMSGGNFAAWLFSYRQRKRSLSAIEANLQKAIDGFERLRFEKSGREWVLTARFGKGIIVDFDQLSDGQRCLIVLYSVLELVQNDASLLLLDEPDSHVTMTEILPFIGALRKKAHGGRMQVIVTSHHPQVIDILASDTAWEFLSTANGVNAQRFLMDRTTGQLPSRYLILRGRR